MSKYLWILLVITALAFAGCGGGSGGGDDQTTTTLIVKVVDSKTDAVIPGISVTVTPDSGTARQGTTDASGSWSSADYPAGRSRVNVSDPKNAYQSFQMNFDISEGLQAYTLTLRLLPTGSTVPDTIVISPQNPVLKIGDKQQFTAAITPDTGMKPTWTLFGNAGTLSADGLFTATTQGTATIIATIGSVSASTLVNVESGSTPTKGAVSGTVYDGPSSPLSGATVTVAGQTTTSDSNGYYVVNDITPGTYTISASKAGYGSASGSIVVKAGVLSTLNITLTPDEFTVRLGQDKTLTTYNYHTWSFDNISAAQRSPNSGNASSIDDTASVSEQRDPGSSQRANARVGANLTWNLNGKTMAEVGNTPCTVTFTYDYTIQADYTDGTGSANAGIKVENFDASGVWYDHIGTDVPEKGTRTRSSITKSYQTTVAKIGDRISVLAQCSAQTNTGAPAGTVNSSSVLVKVKSIKIDF